MRRRSLLGTAARTAVIAKTANAVNAKDQAKRQAASTGQPVASAATDAQQQSADAQIAEIKKFAELKEQGILTEEEFTAKKRQILGL